MELVLAGLFCCVFWQIMQLHELIETKRGAECRERYEINVQFNDLVADEISQSITVN